MFWIAASYQEIGVLLCILTVAMKHAKFSIVLLLTSVFLTSPVPAQDRIATVLDSLPKIKKIEQAAISPDGWQVAYIVDCELFVADVATGSSHNISLVEQKTARDVNWSSNSRRIAWLSDLPGEKPASELWAAASDGSDPVKLADLDGYAQAPRFSPDGTRLAVLYIEGMPRIAGPLQPMTPLSGVVDEKIFEQRITVIDLQTKKLAQITPGDVYVYEYDWTPDSQSWAVTAAHGSGDNNWWIARLYLVDAASGRMREIYKPKWQIADPHVSPDGTLVAFIEGLMSDEGLTGGDVYVVPVAGGAARNLTPAIKASLSSIAWAGPDRIRVVGNVDGNSGVGIVNVGGIPSAATWNGWTGEELIATTTDAWVPAASFSRDGSVSTIVRQSASAPPEVWAGPVGKWKQLTYVNREAKATWGESRNVHWMSGTTRVQGWLMFPKDYDPGKKYPLVVRVHGGPSWACTSHWQASEMGDLTAASLVGWFVLCPNPRGSYGQGEAFTQGNVKDFGGGDFRDVMAGIDALIQEYPIDRDKIGIRGHSYGGYMVMWAETQTTRFAAAVAGAGLSDWQSYYGLNDIDEWMIPFFGASVYDDPAVYQKSDPIRFVRNVKTPTLILVGDSDGEVPMEQSIEWYHALTTMNVPAQLVIYPHEGHEFYKAADARDYTLRMLQWFNRWFGSGGD